MYECAALSNPCFYYLLKKIKKMRISKKFETSGTTWVEEFQQPDRSYSVSNIQDYFEYIIKKHKTLTNNSLTQIQINKTQNKITIKIQSC